MLDDKILLLKSKLAALLWRSRYRRLMQRGFKAWRFSVTYVFIPAQQVANETGKGTIISVPLGVKPVQVQSARNADAQLDVPVRVEGFGMLNLLFQGATLSVFGWLFFSHDFTLNRIQNYDWMPKKSYKTLVVRRESLRKTAYYKGLRKSIKILKSAKKSVDSDNATAKNA